MTVYLNASCIYADQFTELCSLRMITLLFYPWGNWKITEYKYLLVGICYSKFHPHIPWELKTYSRGWTKNIDGVPRAATPRAQLLLSSLLPLLWTGSTTAVLGRTTYWGNTTAVYLTTAFKGSDTILCEKWKSSRSRYVRKWAFLNQQSILPHNSFHTNICFPRCSKFSCVQVVQKLAGTKSTICCLLSNK